MKKISENVWMELNDKLILIELTKYGIQEDFFPRIGSGILGDTQTVPFISYKDGFNLEIFTYCSYEDDSGYIWLHIEKFIEENPVNLFGLLGISYSQSVIILNMINPKVQKLAKDLNYSRPIIPVINYDFVGYMLGLNLN